MDTTSYYIFVLTFANTQLHIVGYCIIQALPKTYRKGKKLKLLNSNSTNMATYAVRNWEIKTQHDLACH